MAIEFKKKPGLVVYLTAGDPDLATTREIALAAIDNGADVIELGVPFSDPLADGPVIQRASERAVAKGTRLSDVLALAEELRAARPECGLVLFSYLNPVLRMGSGQLAEVVSRTAEAEGKYIRQTGGAGNYAQVKIRVEPNAMGSGLEFSNETPEETIPLSFIGPIVQGVRSAMLGGVVAGHEIADLKVTLIDGSFHETDSNPMAFQIAVSAALKEAVRLAGPRVVQARPSMRRFCAAAKEAGVDGVLLTDMIVEEAAEYLAAMQANDLAPIFLAAPTSPDKRLKAIAEASKGFVYAISRVGITGTRDTVASDAPELVARLRQFTRLPIAVGFGISNAAHVKAVGEFADAAIVGSALVALIEKTPREDAARVVGEFVKGLVIGY